MDLNIFTTPLPSSGLSKIDDSAISEITQFLKEKLPQSDQKGVEDGLNWRMILDKRKAQPKQKSVPKKKMLTRKQKKALGLTKLPKAGWEYQKLVKMNEIWRGYVLAALNHPAKLPKHDDPDFPNFCTILNKLELIGSELDVIRSNIPDYVGIRGIVVMETKFTIGVVTKDSKLKTLLKENCVFQMYLNNWRFTMFGKHFVTRTSERSVKKIKYYSISDL